jgi:hypothetical protein
MSTHNDIFAIDVSGLAAIFPFQLVNWKTYLAFQNGIGPFIAPGW